MNTCKNGVRNRSFNWLVMAGMVLMCTTACPTDPSVCEGQDLVRSRELIEKSWLAGLEIATYISSTDDLTGGLNRLIAVSNQLNDEARQLPDACQILVRNWADEIGESFQGSYDGGTNCVGDVCCDDTGCY